MALVTSDQNLVLASWGMTTPGRGKDHNDDYFIADDRKGLFIVTDGIGGHAGGSVASRIAADTVIDFFQEHSPAESDDLANDLGNALRKAHRTLLREAAATPSLSGMGTTMVLAVWQPPEAMWLGGAGDSRAYLLRGGQLRQITRDDSAVQELLRAGTVSSYEARTYFSRNVITQALGIEFHAAHPIALTVRPDDRILLCSDGLWDMVPDDELRQILLAEHYPKPACERLIDTALGAGGKDDITAMLIAVADIRETFV